MKINKKAKTDIIAIILIIALGIFIYLMIQQPQSTPPTTPPQTDEMTRTGPSTVEPGSTFIITYTVKRTGKWGASIVDSVSGGCQFPAGTQLKTVMLSDEGTTKTIQVTAPQSGTCTFTGNYKFGNEPIKNFQSLIVNIK